MNTERPTSPLGTVRSTVPTGPLLEMDMTPAEIVAELHQWRYTVQVTPERLLTYTAPPGIPFNAHARGVAFIRRPDLVAYLLDEPLPVQYGPCCACNVTAVESSQFTYALPLRGLVDGAGWGCHDCHLPLHGAFAVLCADCHRDKLEPLYAVTGPLPSPGRILVRELSEPWRHPTNHRR